MNILVLGGDGFIGSHVVDQLVSMGHEITVFDRFPYRTSRNLEHHRGGIRFISGEFQNRNDLVKALSEKDIRVVNFSLPEYKERILWLVA